MIGCCEDNNLCSYHSNYPTLFFYKCGKCGKYEGSSMIAGHKVIINTKHGSAPLPPKDHWLFQHLYENDTPYTDMIIFNALCTECGKCKCCYGEEKKWEQLEELEAIL